jgi:hypothetical protein
MGGSQAAGLRGRAAGDVLVRAWLGSVGPCQRSSVPPVSAGPTVSVPPCCPARRVRLASPLRRSRSISGRAPWSFMPLAKAAGSPGRAGPERSGPGPEIPPGARTDDLRTTAHRVGGTVKHAESAGRMPGPGSAGSQPRAGTPQVTAWQPGVSGCPVVWVADRPRQGAFRWRRPGPGGFRGQGRGSSAQSPSAGLLALAAQAKVADGKDVSAEGIGQALRALAQRLGCTAGPVGGSP